MKRKEAMDKMSRCQEGEVGSKGGFNPPIPSLYRTPSPFHFAIPFHHPFAFNVTKAQETRGRGDRLIPDKEVGYRIVSPQPAPLKPTFAPLLQSAPFHHFVPKTELPSSVNGPIAVEGWDHHRYITMG